MISLKVGSLTGLGSKLGLKRADPARAGRKARAQGAGRSSACRARQPHRRGGQFVPAASWCWPRPRPGVCSCSNRSASPGRAASRYDRRERGQGRGAPPYRQAAGPAKAEAARKLIRAEKDYTRPSCSPPIRSWRSAAACSARPSSSMRPATRCGCCAAGPIACTPPSVCLPRRPLARAGGRDPRQVPRSLQ